MSTKLKGSRDTALFSFSAIILIKEFANKNKIFKKKEDIKMRNLMTNAKNTAKKIGSKAKSVMQSESGFTGTVEVIILIIAVVAIITVLFMPNIVSWFDDVMSKLATETNNLFDLDSNSSAGYTGV